MSTDKIGDIEFEFIDRPWEFKGRGFVYPCKLIGEYTRTQLERELPGKLWRGQKIIAFESFAIEKQSNSTIGILVENEF